MNLSLISEIVGISASIIAIPTGLYALIQFVINKFFKKIHKFEFDTKQTFFAKYKPFGTYGIAFYSFNIINASDKNIVPKNVNLIYTYNGVTYEIESHVLIPSIIFSLHAKTNVNCIIVTCHKIQTYLVLMSWDNLRTKIGTKTLLEPNGVLSASAFYLLKGVEVNEICNIKDLSLKIIDFSNKITLLPITLTPEIINSIDEQMEITDIEYEQIGDKIIPKDKKIIT